MKRLKLVFLLGAAVLGVVCLVVAISVRSRQPGSLAIVRVTVIDCTGAEPQDDVSVLVADGRIVAIGKSLSIPSDARIVDASGMFLIPGLWDMHAHCEYEGSPDRYLPLHVANGVTGIRDMGGVLRSLTRLRAEIAHGRRIGPRMIVTGETVDGPIDKTLHNAETLRLFAANADQGRACVGRLKQGGADAVKVYSGLDSEAYFAIAAEAKKVGLPLWGHVPEVVRVVDASDAGQRSMEHVLDIMRACSDHEEEMKDEARRALPQGLDAALLVLDAQLQRAPASYNPQKAETVFGRLKKNGTWVCPTLLANQIHTQNGPLTDVVSMRFLSEGAREGANKVRAARSPRDMQTAAALLHRGLEMVGQMQQSGVGLLAGTDGNAAIPGYCLHDELVLLVDAGLAPMEALQTATRNPALFLGKEKEFGTIEVGKIADLVLLRANPLEDIRNTTAIEAVVRDGQLLDRAMLDSMLDDAHTAAHQR